MKKSASKKIKKAQKSIPKKVSKKSIYKKKISKKSNNKKYKKSVSKKKYKGGSLKETVKSFIKPPEPKFDFYQEVARNQAMKDAIEEEKKKKIEQGRKKVDYFLQGTWK